MTNTTDYKSEQDEVSILKTRNIPAARTAGINPFRVMTVLERAQALAREGHSIIHLEVGEPDFETPEPIVAAAQQALSAGHTRYTPAAGLPALRRRLSRFYQERYAVNIDPQRIFITPGASGALVLLSQLLINPGDAVLIPDPAYPCNRNYVHLAGGEVQLLPVTAETNYQPTPALLDRAIQANSVGLWLASPGNPTGTVLDKPALQGLSDWAFNHGQHLVVDEIYHGLDYQGGLPTALAVNDDNFVINSFSKYFGMTGWRLGWLVVPDSLKELADILAQNLFIAASTPAQHAALRAFDADVIDLLETRRAELQRRRDFLLPALRQLGFIIPVETQGAFYIYAGIDGLADDSELFCQSLLEQQGVAITPGTDFGEYRARHSVRFAFTTHRGQLEEAVRRMAIFLGR
ncbi:MAG: pyridoxal phosphate-dependent aminotransferase [Pseudomonadales bacterium]|nr:pyridoxal phosphate-dependent aminotransferase [Pseudomonadales bacterium]